MSGSAMKKLLLLTLAAALQLPLAADTRLPKIFANGMVLQREQAVPLWGWASPNAKLTISFGDQTVAVTADAIGNWRVSLKPMPASAESRDLTITGDGDLTIKDVLVGEVWLCSGQSNMAYKVQSSLGSAEVIAATNQPLLRHCYIPQLQQGAPQSDAPATWTQATPQTVGGWTAVGFYFGRAIQADLKIPVGLINASWGGTRVEPWTPITGFQQVPELATLAEQVSAWDPSTATGKTNYNNYITALKAWIPQAEDALATGKSIPLQPPAPTSTGDHQTPTRIYNAMIHPIQGYGIRGALWYQGESNGTEGALYGHKLRALIRGWRAVWQQGDFPFYVVQLPNFMAPTPNNPAGGEAWAQLREAQKSVLSEPNTGMAVTIDLGEAGDIHPKNKLDVGLRLARVAQVQTYGEKLLPGGPLFKEAKLDGDGLRVFFTQTAGGLMVGKKVGLAAPVADAKGALKGFAVAGEDKIWHWATGTIDGDSVVVSSPDVMFPVAVRYAYSNNPDGANLYNQEGFPAAPFRSDTW